MPSAIGFDSFSAYTLKGSDSGRSKQDVENTINRLEQQRDKYKQQNETSKSELFDKKINNLEDRIDTLKQRLNKLRTEERQEDGECETCKNRKYQDGSNDPGVSFKTASKVTGSAEAAVRGHEQEHVNRNQAKAAREGKEVLYQSVTIKRAICPECGKSYVSGGETVTVTRTKPEEKFQVGLNKNGELGDIMDIVA